MSKIVMQIEINGHAQDFIENLIEDYFYTIKGDAAKLAQYETLKYTIKSATDLDPALNCECGYQH
jgi:hypothetical protein